MNTAEILYEAPQKTPPQSTDVEKYILGTCFVEDEAMFTALEQLEPSDFYAKQNELIFRAIKSLFDKQGEMDLIAVENYLRDQGQLETVGKEYLSSMFQYSRSANKIESYCKTVKDKATKRNLITACGAIIERAYEPSESTQSVVDFADRQIFDVINSEVVSHTHTPREVIEGALEHLLLIQEHENGITGIPSGLKTLDEITAGWQSSNMIVIAARPSMGKTAFALHCLKEAAKDGHVGLLSLETSYKSIGNRLIISEAGIDGQKARKGKLSEEEKIKAQNAAAKLLDMGIIIDDATSVTASKFRAKAKALKKKFDIRMLGVDFLQLMKSDRDNREQQIAEISRACKLLCKELDIPVLALSQLSRKCEGRPGLNKRPQLSDLRESGAIEQDADVVISLFRPEYYGITKYPETEPDNWKGVSTDNICEVIVGKQKDGPTGMARLVFSKQNMRFSDYASPPSYSPKSMTNNNAPF